MPFLNRSFITQDSGILGFTLDKHMSKADRYTDTPIGRKILKADIKKAQVIVPALTPRQRTRVANIRSYSVNRLVNFLAHNQGARTDTISRSIAIGNVSDVALKSRRELHALGLDIECLMMATENRYKTRISIGTWWLRVIDSGAWFEHKAANDSEF